MAEQMTRTDVQSIRVILSEAKDRHRAKAVLKPWMESDPSVASLLQDDF
jgi:hypothetical protein